LDNANSILKEIKIVLNYEKNSEKANQSFLKILDLYFFKDNSFIKCFNEFLDNYYDKLKEIRLNNENNLEIVNKIFPEEKKGNLDAIISAIEEIIAARDEMKEIPTDFIESFIHIKNKNFWGSEQ
jgi:hypothetical protein